MRKSDSPGKWEFWREVWRGKSPDRILMNFEIRRRVRLSGRVVDLGAGGNPSYWRFLPTRAPSTSRLVSIRRFAPTRPALSPHAQLVGDFRRRVLVAHLEDALLDRLSPAHPGWNFDHWVAGYFAFVRK